jgi:hypothetical protein
LNSFLNIYSASVGPNPEISAIRIYQYLKEKDRLPASESVIKELGNKAVAPGLLDFD